MLDTTFNAPKKETIEYKPLPEDMYTVELLDIEAEKRPTYDTRNLPDDQKQYETVLNFHFVLLDGDDKGKSLRGRSVWANFVPSFLYISTKNGKNKLYEIVEAFQNETISPQQEAEGIGGGFLNSLIGQQIRIVTSNTTKGDKTYTQIDRYLGVKVRETPLTTQEKIDATPKPKDAAAEQKAQADYDGITDADIPFES